MSNLVLIAIREELDEVNDLSSYDKLFKLFTELHNHLKKIRMKNASLKKKNVKLSNKNDTLNEKIKCREEKTKVCMNNWIL